VHIVAAYGEDGGAMAKENTHLWFAYDLLKDYPGTDMIKDISNHLWQYLLGAVIPDTFYYGAGDHLVRISEHFHGKEGNPTNTSIFRVLDAARDARDVAFILGYITHCALDITLHPVIYYLSGNYYDADPEKKSQAVYRHRHLETCLDRDLNNPMRLHRLLRVSHLRGLVFEDIVSRDFRVSIGDIRHSLRRQILFNRLFTSRAAYLLARPAVSAGLMGDPAYLGLFYADIAPGECLPEQISVADLMDGHERKTSRKDIFLQARSLAKSMVEAAYAYWLRELDRTGLVRAIPGLSLDTGMLGISASAIRHTLDNDRP